MNLIEKKVGNRPELNDTRKIFLNRTPKAEIPSITVNKNEMFPYGKRQHHLGKVAAYRIKKNFVNYTSDRGSVAIIYKDLRNA